VRGVLGEGAYGFVELVEANKGPHKGQMFALKAVSKQKVLLAFLFPSF
jgi:hypothetical protein